MLDKVRDQLWFWCLLSFVLGAGQISVAYDYSRHNLSFLGPWEVFTPMPMIVFGSALFFYALFTLHRPVQMIATFAAFIGGNILTMGLIDPPFLLLPGNPSGTSYGVLLLLVAVTGCAVSVDYARSQQRVAQTVRVLR
ncbi:MAG TPA: hypothetical protein VEA18_00405 [Candidatus Kapabacteria bacterium]|nr:hypothetical protein [Candidatus Kapabacteria bacterium]